MHKYSPPDNSGILSTTHLSVSLKKFDISQGKELYLIHLSLPQCQTQCLVKVGTQCLLSGLEKQPQVLVSTFGWIKLTYFLLYVASTLKIHTCFRKVICSPHKLTEERRREAKRQEQRKPKSISGECQISWVGIPQNRNKWEARRLELRAGSDQMSLPFGLHCISSFHSSLPTLTLLWAPRG